MSIPYGKLVRDGIPQIIQHSGKSCTTRVLTETEYIEALDWKLQEELDEYLADGAMEELADLLEVMMAVAAAQGSSWEEIEALRRDKAYRRGGFEGRIFLHEVYED